VLGGEGGEMGMKVGRVGGGEEVCGCECVCGGRWGCLGETGCSWVVVRVVKRVQLSGGGEMGGVGG
jgi:hypothetical protein